MNIPKNFLPHKDEFTVVDYFREDHPTTYMVCEKRHFRCFLSLSDKISIKIELKYIIIYCDFGSTGWRKHVFLFSEENLKMIKNILKC